MSYRLTSYHIHYCLNLCHCHCSKSYRIALCYVATVMEVLGEWICRWHCRRHHRIHHRQRRDYFSGYQGTDQHSHHRIHHHQWRNSFAGHQRTDEHSDHGILICNVAVGGIQNIKMFGVMQLQSRFYLNMSYWVTKS